MGKPHLVLHAGFHKTGTTALQNALYQNRYELADRGVIYPEVAAFARRKAPSHYAFANSVAGGLGFDVDGFVEHLSAMSAGRTVVLSAEAVCRHYRNVSSVGMYGEGFWDASGDAESYWQGKVGYLEAVKDVLGSFDVTPVLFLRRDVVALFKLEACPPSSPPSSGDGFDLSPAKGGEAVHDCNTDLDFGGLAIGVS